MAMIRYNDGDAGDAFTATTGSNINLSSSGPLTGTNSWAYTSSSAANFKRWDLSSGQPTTYSVWMRFRVSSFSSSAQRLLRGTDSSSTNAWHVDLTATGRLRLRPSNTATLLNEMVTSISLDTTYVVQVDVNHTTNVVGYTLRASGGTIIETWTSGTGQSIGTNGDAVDFGAILGSVSGLNYKFEAYWADTYEGPVPASQLDTPVVTVSETSNPTTVGGTNGSVTVTWPAVSGAATYEAGRAAGINQTTGFTITSSAATSPYTFTGLAAGPYTLAIRANP